MLYRVKCFCAVSRNLSQPPSWTWSSPARLKKNPGWSIPTLCGSLVKWVKRRGKMGSRKALRSGASRAREVSSAKVTRKYVRITICRWREIGNLRNRFRVLTSKLTRLVPGEVEPPDEGFVLLELGELQLRVVLHRLRHRLPVVEQLVRRVGD